jgi:hypothetical protein
MKRTKFATIFLIAAVLLAACGSTSTPAPASSGAEAYTSQTLVTTYDGALPVRNQLALGTLELEGTPDAITAEQAETLLPLWQALLSTQKSGAAAQAEVSALLEQIEKAMTPEQLQAISNLQLNQSDLQAWASANDVAMGAGGGQPGQGQGLSPEERAARQAAEGKTPGSSGGGVATAIITAVIDYLGALAP